MILYDICNAAQVERYFQTQRHRLIKIGPWETVHDVQVDEHIASRFLGNSSKGFILSERQRRGSVQFDVHNPNRAAREIFPYGDMTKLRINPGQTVKGVDIRPHVLPSLRKASDLVITEANGVAANGALVPDPNKPVMIIDGMYGIGDNIHQRAVMRDLLKTYQVYLIGPHFSAYWDLVERHGLKVVFKPTKLRAQSRIIAQGAASLSQGGDAAYQPQKENLV